MNGKLSRLSKSAFSGLTRSEETTGQFIEYPTIGKQFSIISDGNRFWQTSAVSLIDVSIWSRQEDQVSHEVWIDV